MMRITRGNPFLPKMNIRNSIFLYYSITALLAIVVIGVSFYTRLADSFSQAIIEENSGLVNQLNQSVGAYIKNIMNLSNSLSYGVIKNTDLEHEEIGDEFYLLYDNNKDFIEDISLFSGSGELLEVFPASRMKTGYEPTNKDWFTKPLRYPDRMHFSELEVQNLFSYEDNKYSWVVKFSRAVEVTQNGKSDYGVLLIDLSYAGLEKVIDNVRLGNNGYVYLIDSSGDIIWHPRGNMINTTRFRENNLVHSTHSDGVYEEKFEGNKRTVIVRTVGYTGWKIIGVTPQVGISLNSIKTRWFMIFAFSIMVFIFSIINAYISAWITEPIQELEKSVNTIENGDLDAKVYIGGSYEIEHLGRSIDDMRGRIRGLMEDLDAEHELKRQKEFEVLQEQINPHFLYNTLESVIWMISSENQEKAVKMVAALAKFFRIGLSAGVTEVTVEKELEHVERYLEIQRMRSKIDFHYEIRAEEDLPISEIYSLKIILQPIVENAIKYGMEYMYGDGILEISVRRDENDIVYTIKDNGPGMTQDKIDKLLELSTKRVVSKGGSGIGVKNVNERIKHFYGDRFGLSIFSELDEGTEVQVRIPLKYVEKGRDKKEEENER